MPQGHRVRLPDGSVIHLDRNALREWHARGLIGEKDLVEPPGSKKWVPLAEVLGLKQKAPPKKPPTTVPSRPRRAPAPSRLVPLAAGAALVALMGAGWWTYPRWRPLLSRAPEQPAQVAAAAPENPSPLRLAVGAVTREAPHLTQRTAETLMVKSAAGVLEPPEAFRRAYFHAGRGLSTLDAGKAREFRALNSALYASLPAAERTRLGTYIERVRARRPTSPQEDADMCGLMRKAVLRLPTPQQAKLRALFEEAVLAALETTPAG